MQVDAPAQSVEGLFQQSGAPLIVFEYADTIQRADVLRGSTRDYRVTL